MHVVAPSPGPFTRGGGIAVGGGGGGVKTNCEKLRKIAEKLRHCKQPSVTLKVQQFWTGGSDFFQSYKRSMGSTITGGAPQYHMELKHEPKAAGVVIFKRGQKGVLLFYKIVYTSMVQH